MEHNSQLSLGMTRLPALACRPWCRIALRLGRAVVVVLPSNLPWVHSPNIRQRCYFIVVLRIPKVYHIPPARSFSLPKIPPGFVYNFDQRGCSREQWSLCLSVPLPVSRLSDAQWDQQLARHNATEHELQKYRKYQQLKNNCYDYVIRFLDAIRFEGSQTHMKDDIVLRFIRTWCPP